MKTTRKLPNDPALPGLTTIRARGLAAAFPSLGLDGGAELLLCGYSRGKRATLEVRAGERHFAVKAYAEDPSPEAELYDALAARGLGGDAGGSRVPRLLAWEPDLDLLAISWLEGRTAHQLLESGEGERAGELAARWLQRAASLAVRLGPPVGAKQVLRRTVKWAATLGAAHPSLGTAAADLAAVLARTQPEERVWHLVHTGLYARHIVELDDGPGLIDWHRFGQGPLELDAGMFLASLFRDIDTGPRLSDAVRAQESFLAGITGLVDERALAWHWAAALLKLAARECKPARREQPDHVARAQSTLSEAMRLAEGATVPVSPTAPDAAALRLASQIHAAAEREARGGPAVVGEPPLTKRLAAALCAFKGWTLELVLHALATERATPEELEQIRQLLDEVSGRAAGQIVEGGMIAAGGVTAADVKDRLLDPRLARYLWRDDEVQGTVGTIRLRHGRQSKRGVTWLCLIDLRSDDGRSVEQVYAGYEVGPGALPDEYAAALERATRQPPVGRAVTAIPEANIVLLAFPNDRRMDLVSESELRAWLARHADVVAGGSREGARWELAHTEIAVLRWKPEKRLTLRCRGALRAGGTERPFGIILKQFHELSTAERLHRNLLALGEGWNGRPVRVPRALGIDRKRAVVFMEELPGRELKDVVEAVELERVMYRVGEMVADLHQARGRVDERTTARDQLTAVSDRVQAVSAAFPAARPRLDAIATGFRAMIPDETGPEVLLHGACRIQHVFIDGDSLGLIDVDGLKMGHPALDLAHFLSSLYYLEAQERIEPAVRRISVRRFLEGYAARAPWPIPASTALWWVAGLFIHKQARKYVTHLHEDSEEKVQQILALAEATLAEASASHADRPLAELWAALPLM